MNSQDLFKAIGKVDEDILEKSEIAANVRKVKNRWLQLGAVAACLCLVVVGAIIWKQIRPFYTARAGIASSETGQTDEWTTKDDADSMGEDLETANGVTIPRMEVSLSANETADMIGFFIYQDRCYVQYDWFYDAVDFIGEHLGTATGRIDEWTPKEGYVEFAGSVRGNFYAVKGYDPAFILCMKQSTGVVSTYICNNGITLTYGSELYEDRFHLSGNLESVQYESRASWFYGQEERYQMNGVNDIVLNFIQEMDSAQFVTSDAVPLDEGQNIVDTELYHLYFQMESGMTVHLRLYENGYVMCQGMWDLYVQVPEESYNALLDILDNHTDSTAIETAGAVGPTFEDCLNDPELGRYVPTYAPDGLCFANAYISYYLDDETAGEVGTQEIWLDYNSLENPRYYCSITVTWADEHGKDGWAGPMINAADLSVELLSEYFKPETVDGNPLPEGSLNVGVWYDDVSVVFSAYGVNVETAYAILSSVQ